MKRRLALAIALLSLAASASAGVPRAAALIGTSWKVVRIDGKPPASPRAELRFLPERLSATAGCNGMGGTWQIKGGRLVGGPFMSTMMYCQSVPGDDSLMAQERALADLLAARPTLDLRGKRLVLRSLGHSLELVRVP